MTAGPWAVATPRRRAPLRRAIAAELHWVLVRPRTLGLLGLFAVVPLALGLLAAVMAPATGGLGVMLPATSLSVLLSVLPMPLAVTLAGADAIAGERAQGTLRALLVAPVGRLRLVVMKGAGVVAVAGLSVVVTVVAGALVGTIAEVATGGRGGTMDDVAAAALTPGAAAARLGLASVWTLGQLAAVGAVALAVSSVSRHTLVVAASVLGWLMIGGALGLAPGLGPVRTVLLSSGWSAATDVLTDPMSTGTLTESTWRALVYLVLGMGFTCWRMTRCSA